MKTAMMSIKTKLPIGPAHPSKPKHLKLHTRSRVEFCFGMKRTGALLGPSAISGLTEAKHNQNSSKMSKKHDKNFSLSEKLSSLIHTKPSIVESDDEDLTTVDKMVAPENDSDVSVDELEVPKYRKINNTLLDEDDNKYSGKGVSRSDINSKFDEDSTDTMIRESYDEDELSDVSALDKVVETVNKKTPQNDNFNTEIFSKTSRDIEKGKGIKNQLHIWDFFLDCRMKFQKSLVACNQFPNYQNLPKFICTGGLEFQTSISQTRSSIRNLLRSLLTLQDELLNLNEDYLNTISNENKNKFDESDEEIESDTDVETEKEKIPKNVKSVKLKKINSFSEELNKRHKQFETYRNNTIQKWNDKTRVSYVNNKNFSAFEQSTLKQIQHVLLDKQRLTKRTQTKRSNYHILGEHDEPLNKTPKIDDENVRTNDVKSKAIHKEIFDDDDFYHHLLSELVKRKANDITDPVQLGRQWMQLQKIRSKMKKTVDMKASKGRKIRFVVHPKLVNFMMSVDDSIYNEESRTELLNSLFGKNKK